MKKIKKYNMKENQIWFSKSIVDTFRHTNKSLRYGQVFYQFMKLEKCIQDKIFCD